MAGNNRRGKQKKSEINSCRNRIGQIETVAETEQERKILWQRENRSGKETE